VSNNPQHRKRNKRKSGINQCASCHGAVIKFEVFRKGVPEKLKFSFTSKQFSDAKRFVHQVLEESLNRL